jgi:membrane-bound serine protease (ClpP class)
VTVAISLAVTVYSEPADVVLKVSLTEAITGATAQTMEDAISVGKNMDAGLIIVTADTPGGEINAVKDVMNQFEASPTPICFYVYPPGASAWSGGTYLLVSSHVAAMSSGTVIGSAQPVRITGEPINDTKQINALTALIANHAALHARNTTTARRFVSENLNLGPEEALKYGVIEVVSDDIPSLLEKLQDRTLVKVETEMGTSTWKLVKAGEAPEDTLTRIKFEGLSGAESIEYKPSLQYWLLQIIYDPTVASLMFSLGFYLLIIGVQTPGLGAEFVGGLFLLLSLMSFQVIGIEPVSLTLFAVGFAMVIADLKMHTGFLGFAGGLCIILGTLFIVPSPHWLLSPEVSRRIRNTLIGASLVIFAIFSFIIIKVSQAGRQDVKTGPETLIGIKGETTSWLDPRGEVRVLGETWRARAENPPIEVGCKVDVIDREGLVLVVRALGAAEKKKQGVKKNV